MQTGCQLRIAICDDEKMSREQNALMTKKVLNDANIIHSITKYETANALLTDIHNGVEFHILLLDVMMDEMDGMELAKELRQQKIKSDIIFISGDREMALRGYEVAAARYLAKPVLLERLKEALLYCCQNRQENENKEILLPTMEGQYRTSVSDIQYVEAFERGTRFVLKKETVDTKLKINEVEELLPKVKFAQCHRAYIVNISYVKSIRRYEFVLRNNEIVPIGRARYGEMQKWFREYTAE